MSAIESYESLSDKERLYQSYSPEITPESEGYIPVLERLEENTGKPLAERVQLLNRVDNRFSNYKIDQCVRAKTVSDSFRNAMIQYWTDAGTEYWWQAFTCVVIAGVSGGVAWYTFNALPLIATLAATIYGAYSVSEHSGTKDQIIGWERSPAETIATKRRQAYEQGFRFAYHNNLKLTGPSSFAVLLPVEMQHLHNRYWDHFCKELLKQSCNTSKQKKAWLDQFRTINPVSEPVLRYVYGIVPDALNDLSQNVNRVTDSLRNIERDFERIRAQRQQEAQAIKDSIESKRMIARVAADATLEWKLYSLENEKANKLREWTDREGANVRERNMILENYDLKAAPFRAAHALAVSGINIYFDSKIKEADDALQKALKAAKRQEADAFSPYYEYCTQLVDTTLGAKEGRLVAPPPAFNPARVLDVPMIPKIEVNFVLQLPPGTNAEFANALRQQAASSFQVRN